MGDPRSFPADEAGYAEVPRRRGRGAAPEPADRHARLAARHAQLTWAAARSTGSTKIDWHVPVAPGTDPEDAAEAGGRGAPFLAQGDGGFYAQVVRMPPGFDAPTHSHDHAEVFMVLEGSCDFDGQPMKERDMTVVSANHAVRIQGRTRGPVVPHRAQRCGAYANAEWPTR